MFDLDMDDIPIDLSFTELDIHSPPSLPVSSPKKVVKKESKKEAAISNPSSPTKSRTRSRSRERKKRSQSSTQIRVPLRSDPLPAIAEQPRNSPISYSHALKKVRPTKKIHLLTIS